MGPWCDLPRNSDERTAALDGWLWHYNCQHRHSASATSPRSLVLTREEPAFSGLTPRSHGCAYEPARFADRATREDNKRSNGRRATPRPRPTRLGVTEMNAKATPGAGPRR